MRWLRRSLRFLILGISLSSLYIVCFLQLSSRRGDNGPADQDSDNFVATEPDVVLATLVPANQLLDISNFSFLKNASRVCRTATAITARAITGPDDEEDSHVPPYLVAFIHSAPSNFAKRNVIRETWADRKTLLRLNARAVFVIGLSNDTAISALLDKESGHHQDIVQGNFVDTYKNLTYKHLAGYKWVQEHCDKARFVMKVDDDAFVDIYHIVSLLGKTFDGDPFKRPSGVLACSLFPNGTQAKRDGKWALTTEEYAEATYPAYCSGIAYFLTPDVLSHLYVAAHYLAERFIWIDDLFVTGIVASAIKVRHQPLNLRFAYDPRRLLSWLEWKGEPKASPYLIGDIGDTVDWTGLMFRLWEKTIRVWR